MIHEVKPYPVYKDSGVRWLGEVPIGWEVRRNGRLFAERKETGFPDLPIMEVSLKTGVRVRDFGLARRKQEMLDRHKYKRAASGDIAYNMMRMWQGAVGVAPADGLVSPAYVVARPFPGTVASYFAYLYRTSAYMGEVNNYSHGIVSDRNRLYWDEFKQIPTPYPPPDEQAPIVRFLDHADRRVRHYISAKQKLIRLLEEQKQAIIHQAVTRGFNPNVLLKPSGVEWLNDVPKDWEVTRLGRLIELITGFPFKSEGFTQATEEIRILRGINISTGEVRWNDVIRWPSAERKKLARYELQLGDIVLGMDRPIIHGGVRVAVIENFDLPSLVVQRVARIRPHQRLRADFLVMLLGGTSFSNYLTPIFTGISVPHLSPEQIKSFRFALPNLEEQGQIVERVALATTGVQSTVERTRQEISLLREYRTGLIADVVTGKLDVREAAANLPTETDESELALATSELDEEPEVDLSDVDAVLEE